MERKDEKYGQTLTEVIWIYKGWVLFFYFSPNISRFLQSILLQKYKYVYSQKKKILLKKIKSILNDFKICHSANLLKLRAFLPSQFVPLSLVEWRNPTALFPRVRLITFDVFFLLTLWLRFRKFLNLEV